MEAIIERWKDVFTNDSIKVGKTDLVSPFRIDLEPNANPVRQRSRPLTPEQVQALRKQLDEWLADGVIEPSDSPWASPMVPVLKKDGSIRWAIDYHALNLKTVADSFPTPRIDEVIACFAGSRVFSALDAAQAFHNIPGPWFSNPNGFCVHFWTVPICTHAVWVEECRGGVL